jgi:hypothetical protein
MSLLTDLLDAQVAILESDIKTDLVPLVQQSNNLIASNPTVANVVLQGQRMLVNLIAEGPKVAQDEVKELASWVNTKLEAWAAPPPASTAPTSATASPTSGQGAAITSSAKPA